MQIRLAAREDVPAVMEVVKKVIPLMQAAGNFQWNEDYPNETVFYEDIEKSQCWVADVDGVIAGVVVFAAEQEQDYAQLGWNIEEPAVVPHRLAVDPTYRGANLGMKLMQKAEDVAREKGIRLLRVDTNSQNQAMQKLFPRLGYTYVGDIALRIRPGQRFCCYEKVLE